MLCPETLYRSIDPMVMYRKPLLPVPGTILDLT